MASFIAKQVVGSQLLSSSSKASENDNQTEQAENLSDEERAKLEEEERERLLALQEQEELRKKKHEKLEEERERMRDGVRQKYSLRKDVSKEDVELRRKQEAEMASNIAAMDPRNETPEASSSRRIAETLYQQAANEEAAETATTKLLRGNVSGAAAQVATKVQSLLPQKLSMFKGKDQ